MASCPFCRTDVDDNLVIHGGPCPKCFAEIPGEEAPTDPGEERKAAQRVRDQRRAMIRAVIPFALATPVVLLLAILALVVVYRPFAPEVVALDFDDEDYGMVFEFVSAVDQSVDRPATPEPVIAPRPVAENNGGTDGGTDSVEAVASAGNDGAGGTDAANVPPVGASEDAKKKLLANSKLFGDPGSTNLGGSSDPFANLAGGDDKVASAEGGLRSRSGYDAAVPDAPDLNLERTRTSQATSLGISVGSGPAAEREKGKIEDPEQIKEHVLKVMAANAPTLKQCYDVRLKENENLEGAWRIDFVVTTAGEVRDVKATGRQMNDASFEECLVRKVKQWTFSQLPHDQPVGKSFTFRPS